MEKENAQNLAEKIALLVQSEAKESDNSEFLRANFEKIVQRLNSIESQLNSQISKQDFTNHKTVHISQQKFTNLEELADEVINSLQNEKACPYEPTGKPCDNCAMCNSLGF